MRELTVDDIKYVSETGTVIYMDKIEGFDTDRKIMIYNGENYDLSQDRFYDLLYKKDNYELLKLNTSKNKLKDFVEAEAEKVLNDTFVNLILEKMKTFDNVIFLLSEESSKLKEEFTQVMLDKVSTYNGIISDFNQCISDIISDLNNYKSILKSNVVKQNDIDSSLNKLLESDFADKIENLKLKLEENFINAEKSLYLAKDDLKEVTSKLKDLFE